MWAYEPTRKTPMSIDDDKKTTLDQKAASISCPHCKAVAGAPCFASVAEARRHRATCIRAGIDASAIPPLIHSTRYAAASPPAIPLLASKLRGKR